MDIRFYQCHCSNLISYSEHAPGLEALSLGFRTWMGSTLLLPLVRASACMLLELSGGGGLHARRISLKQVYLLSSILRNRHAYMSRHPSASATFDITCCRRRHSGINARVHTNTPSGHLRIGISNHRQMDTAIGAIPEACTNG